MHVCAPEELRELQEELARATPAARHTVEAPGWIRSELPAEEAGAEPVLAFARQILPLATVVRAESISQWARQAVDLAIGEGDRPADAGRAGEPAPGGSWRLHVFGIQRPGGAAGPRRIALTARRIEEELLERRRRLARRRTTEPGAAWARGESLLQVGLLSATEGFLSWAGPEVRRQMRHVLSRYPGGATPAVERNLKAPSRAFAKLVEAQDHFGRWIARGETCVDLGASPGGWTYVAAERGARVIAVDRSPLEPALMRRPGVEFQKGDAFRFRPTGRVDWMLCDVAAFPQRTLELLEDWLGERRCRRFIVTVKFRGRDDYPLTGQFAELIRRHASEFSIRRLNVNKNEMTVMGELSE